MPTHSWRKILTSADQNIDAGANALNGRDIIGFNPGENRVIQSDSQGNLSWGDPATTSAFYSDGFSAGSSVEFARQRCNGYNLFRAGMNDDMINLPNANEDAWTDLDGNQVRFYRGPEDSQTAGQNFNLSRYWWQSMPDPHFVVRGQHTPGYDPSLPAFSAPWNTPKIDVSGIDYNPDYQYIYTLSRPTNLTRIEASGRFHYGPIHGQSPVMFGGNFLEDIATYVAHLVVCVGPEYTAESVDWDMGNCTTNTHTDPILCESEHLNDGHGGWIRSTLDLEVIMSTRKPYVDPTETYYTNEFDVKNGQKQVLQLNNGQGPPAALSDIWLYDEQVFPQLNPSGGSEDFSLWETCDIVIDVAEGMIRNLYAFVYVYPIYSTKFYMSTWDMELWCPSIVPASYVDFNMSEIGRSDPYVISFGTEGQCSLRINQTDVILDE